MLPRVAVMAVFAGFLATGKAPERPLLVVTTDSLEFTGGTIRVDNAYGELNVEGWDEPRVEITVTRTAFRNNTPQEQEQGKAYLNKIHVTAKKNANGDVEISTQFPGRNRLVRTIWGLGNFNLDYRIKAPRNAKLAIHHGLGDVMVRDVTGDIDATIRTGDILVQLPEPEKYAIDAQCRFGDIFTDFDGTHRSPWLVGQKFESGSGRSLHLRALLGGISIQRIPAVSFPTLSPPAF
jgi:hypothetical protein